MIKLRLAGIVPLLTAGGFKETPLVPGQWTEFSSLSDEQRATLRDRHGLWIRVHPHDQGELAKLGLDFQRDPDKRPRLQDPLVELAAAIADNNDPPPDQKDGGTTTNTETPGDSATGKSKRKDR